MRTFEVIKELRFSIGYGGKEPGDSGLDYIKSVTHIDKFEEDDGGIVLKVGQVLTEKELADLECEFRMNVTRISGGEDNFGSKGFFSNLREIQYSTLDYNVQVLNAEHGEEKAKEYQREAGFAKEMLKEIFRNCGVNIEETEIFGGMKDLRMTHNYTETTTSSSAGFDQDKTEFVERTFKEHIRDGK